LARYSKDLVLWAIGSTLAALISGLGAGPANASAWSAHTPDIERGVLLAVEGHSLKDPYVVRGGDTYHMFHTFFSNDDGVFRADIGHATSPDLRRWSHRGVAVEREIAWEGTPGPLWAPAVVEQDGVHHMFVSGLVGGRFRSGYLTSASLASGYVWEDHIRDESGAIIFDRIDCDIARRGGEFYLALGAQFVDLHRADSLTSNRWAFVNRALTVAESWEGSIIEAPSLVSGDVFHLFYGGNDSAVNQRIGLATAAAISGEYTRVGSDGMLPLEFPRTGDGPLSHPALIRSEEEGLWYLFACAGTETGGHGQQVIVGYTSPDLVDWQLVRRSAGAGLQIRGAGQQALEEGE
jgi:hypothetical protein